MLAAPVVEGATRVAFSTTWARRDSKLSSAKLGNNDTGPIKSGLCLLDASDDSPAACLGSVELRMLWIDLILYPEQRDWFSNHGGVKEAHRLFRPTSAELAGAVAHDEQGLGDEALSWWREDASVGAERHVVFRVSNVVAEIKLSGHNYSQGSDRKPVADSPELRADLQANAWSIAEAVEGWLRRHWNQ